MEVDKIPKLHAVMRWSNHLKGGMAHLKGQFSCSILEPKPLCIGEWCSQVHGDAYHEAFLFGIRCERIPTANKPSKSSDLRSPL